MSIEPIRRSSRRGAKKRVYAVGDLVEIHDKTTDRVFQGRLVSKVLESSALNPRWMVSLNEEENLLDQEAYESSFGEILAKATDTTITTPITASNVTPDLTDTTTTTAKNSANNNSKKSSRKREAVTPDAEAITSSSSNSSSGSGNEQPEESHKRRKATTTVSFADDVVDHQHKTAAARAREERSRRRQATHPEPVVVGGVVHPNHRKPTRIVDPRRNHKKKTTTPSSSSSSSSSVGNKQDAKDVVRVPMLTGTLILYRGRHRRAEFVRHV